MNSIIKIRLKEPQIKALSNYISECAHECAQSAALSDFMKVAYWIVEDLREKIEQKASRNQQSYTINFKPQEAFIFLALKGKSYDPYEKNVVRQIRADLDKASK